MQDFIFINKTKVHNLKNISLKLPKYKLIVFTGLSGSGKSSLAFDTIYAEGKRKYLESLSSYARQFLGFKDKPNVESIEGLSPTILIDQKNANYNPRSTVGTVTEIFDYLRVMFARIGTPYCINGHGKINTKTKNVIFQEIISLFLNKDIVVLSPVVIRKKGTHKDLILKLRKDGFLRLLIDDKIRSLDEEIELDKRFRHSIYVMVDRFNVSRDEDADVRLTESIEAASEYSNGIIIVRTLDNKEEKVFSEKYSCLKCDYSISNLEPNSFSFNSPVGACKTCDGLGVKFAVNRNLLFDYSKSIMQGGIEFLKNLVKTSNLLWQEYLQLYKHYEIDVNKPVSQLTESELEIILRGSKEPLRYVLESDNGTKYKKFDYIEGVGTRIERLYNETQSEAALTYYKSFMSEKVCLTCNGNRLNAEILNVFINKKSIADVCNMTIEDSHIFLNKLKLNDYQKQILESFLKEIVNRLYSLVNIGVGYLTLARQSNTLSGGEFQRIRLASQIGTRLTGVLYILDEPSIGLHQKDNFRLIQTLKEIRDLGNTVIVVEHDEEIMYESDFIVDIGPAAGIHGGEVIDACTPEELIKNGKGITSKYLRGEKKVTKPWSDRKASPNQYVEIIGATENNLQNLSVKIPMNLFVCITGISGSGKSSLINNILVNGLKNMFGIKVKEIGKHKKIVNHSAVEKIIAVSQNSIGKTSRSNPATYVGLFTDIRELYCKTAEARARGYKSGKFSFNMPSGRCQKCSGQGELQISMLFMADVHITCDECNGKKYKREVLQIYYRNKNIADVLDMTVDQAAEFFKNQTKIYQKLEVLQKTGLGYIKLKQSAPSLSGGEAQRVKLAFHLLKKSTKNTLYVFDEPTTGLHFDDINKLIKVFNEIVNRGDSIVIIEHNLDIIKIADYIIDLGPESGNKGGKIFAQGTPEQIAQTATYTGEHLKVKLELDSKK